VGGHGAVVSLGGPAVGTEVHRSTRREAHTFAQQQGPLQHGTVIVAREGDATRRVDDAPPGHVVLFGSAESAQPTVRAAPGRPARRATMPYVATRPFGMCRTTR